MFSISILFLLVSGVHIPEYQKSDKKIVKTLNSIWPDQYIETQAILDIQIAKGEVANKVVVDGEHAGYFITAQSNSKFDQFDYMVVFDLEGKILQPKILVYREDYGGEIASKRWLRQFIGMDKTSNMDLGKEVQNIAGATISCESASRGFKQASQSIDRIISESQ